MRRATKYLWLLFPAVSGCAHATPQSASVCGQQRVMIGHDGRPTRCGALVALAPVMRRAAACWQDNALYHVDLSFRPDGVVRAARASLVRCEGCKQSDAPEPTVKSCVENVASTALLPHFRGSAYYVRFPLRTGRH